MSGRKKDGGGRGKTQSDGQGKRGDKKMGFGWMNVKIDKEDKSRTVIEIEKRKEGAKK